MAKAYFKQDKESPHEVTIRLSEEQQFPVKLLITSNASDGIIARGAYAGVGYILDPGQSVTIVIED